MNLKLLLHYYLTGFWDRRWSIIVIAWLVCAAGWVMVALLPDRYTSSARVFVNTESLLAPLMRGLAVQPDIERQVDMVRRTLLARPNLQRLIRMTDLDHTLTSTAEDAEARLLREIESRLVIESERGGLFTLSYIDADPRLAQQMVEGMLSIFVELNLGNNRRDMEDALRFIEAQVAEYDRQLREQEQRLAEFRRRHADTLTGQNSAADRLDRAQTELRRLETELQAAIWRRDQVELELARTPARFNDPAAAAAGPSPAAARVAALEAELDQLLARYTERHPDVIALRRTIGLARRDLAGAAAGSPGDAANPVHEALRQERDRLSVEIEAMERRIALRQDEIEETRARVQAVPEIQAQEAQLNRDYDVLVANYEALIERRESARLAQRLEDQTTNVEFRIIEPPIIPIQPSGPNRPLFFAAVLVFGIGAGFGFAFLRMQINQTFLTLADLRAAFDLPVLGSVSPVRTPLALRLHMVELSMFAGTIAGLLVLFAGLIYLYQFSVMPPDLSDLPQRALGRLRGLL